jgi:hypothetical protein
MVRVAGPLLNVASTTAASSLASFADAEGEAVLGAAVPPLIILCDVTHGRCLSRRSLNRPARPPSLRSLELAQLLQ